MAETIRDSEEIPGDGDPREIRLIMIHKNMTVNLRTSSKIRKYFHKTRRRRRDLLSWILPNSQVSRIIPFGTRMQSVKMAQPNAQTKPVHTIILDTSPILLNTPSISTLRSLCTILVTTTTVISELRGEEARSRFETLYQPFIETRIPKPESLKLVRDFARRTGDLAVLSVADIEIIALAYDLECERNGGDWRLRKEPGQKRLNGKKPEKQPGNLEDTADRNEHGKTTEASTVADSETTQDVGKDGSAPPEAQTESEVAPNLNGETECINIANLKLTENESETVEGIPDTEESEDSDGGWITPSNLKRRQAQDEEGLSNSKEEGKVLQVATMTGDFAMQNVLLQMNLNLLSTKTCKRIANIRQTILRCHACFQTTKDMTKQFCPRCGKPTLTRVTCTTNDRGEVKLHLKQNFQWNNRGNVFSVPKPTSGSANQKWKGAQDGGGQRGWGNNLILSEDQKEYARAVSKNKRTKQRDLMDRDTLPDFVSGDRSHQQERIQIGAGRNINSKKR